MSQSLTRRAFFRLSGMTALAACSRGLFSPAYQLSMMPVNALIRPKRLRPGATVALIAPSSPPADEKLSKAVANLTAFGLNIVEGRSLRARTGHLAGLDEQRLYDLHRAFSDDAIDAIWCVRGGYGAGRLLPMLDYALIARHPKLLIGYSDITALHIAIHQRTGLVTMHGPVGAADFPDNTLQHFKSVVQMPVAPYHLLAQSDPVAGPEFQPYVIRTGTARGALTGGNLTLLAALAGTPDAPVFKDKIVFLEDVGEQPYRIDRMLTQLLQATDLRAAAGIVLGVFYDCQPKPDSFSYSLRETFELCLGPLSMPIVYGMPFGHVAHQATLPYGIHAELDAAALRLSLLETAVTD